DPNPQHRGRAFKLLQHAGLAVSPGVLVQECEPLNETFNHWIVHRTPFVTVKAAMTLDGKIATASGQSKWITGEQARNYGMKSRQGADAILVGINTVLADDPSLTFRGTASHQLRRIVLDSRARTPLQAKVVRDVHAALTTIVVSRSAPKQRVAALAKYARVLVAPTIHGSEYHGPSALDLRWLLKKLGSENITSLLIEGGGETNASFLMQGLVHRVALFYAPKVLGGRDSRPAVAGGGVKGLDEAINLTEVKWRQLGPDLLLTARVIGRELT